MNNYIIAVDGGGTKTEFCTENLSTGEVRSFVFGSANYQSSSAEIAQESIVGGFAEVCKTLELNPQNVCGMVCGLAGCDTPENMQFYQTVAAKLPLSAEKLFLCNDSEMLLLSEVDKGICVVAGTGSIAMGIGADQVIQRAGGWGIPLSDEGSGWWIGSQMLREYLRWQDGICSAQPYFDRLTAQLGQSASAQGLAAAICLSTKETAALAQDIMDAAAQGDVFCAELVTRAAGHIADIVGAVYRRLGLGCEPEITILTVGSLFKDLYFKELVRNRLNNSFGICNAVYRCPSASPARGALRLAKKLFV
ncbi:MAG: BadF/BadG/BcrA/BcrD ATPase family protein [Pygmaiobacter sp.]